MQSIVVLYVDHGETNDPVTQLIDNAFFAPGATVFNYDVAVDVTQGEAEVFFSEKGDMLGTIIGRNYG